MKRNKWLLLCLPLLVALAGCATWQNIGTFNAGKSDIKTVALLPLYIDPNVSNITWGVEEVKGFQEAWTAQFNAMFKNRISFINGIKILYPGEDFDVTPDMQVKPDYVKIASTLKVDMVMGFSLVQYNEVSPGEAFVQGCLSNRQERSVAGFNFHNVRTSGDDLNAFVQITPGGIMPSNEQQRQKFIEGLIAWVDLHHPLSVNYKD
ncbi:MAG: hypothetical protein JXD23_12610 [Spirochaetales bacterium]|nr:hypothetical protein [Spirochaetales bacterium]